MVGDHESGWVAGLPDAAPEAHLAVGGNDAAKPVSTAPAAELLGPEEPEGWTDALTGCDGPRFWERVVSSEQARNVRHKRTATIALIEFAGLGLAERRWGRDVAVQLFQRLARVLASGIRSSDHIARIGRTRFGVLLVETDEVLAINFVDRIRERCTAELDPALDGIRVAIGWSSPDVGGRLAEAERLAGERLEADLVRQF